MAISARGRRHQDASVLRTALQAAGLDPKAWAPRELRHNFVSILSDSGVPIEDIARLVGHRGTVVTEAVYRKQLRPVLISGAEAWDKLLEEPKRSSATTTEDAPGRARTSRNRIDSQAFSGSPDAPVGA